MPKTGVFTLVGPHAGKTMVILDKYPFTEGVFKTPALYAPLMAAMLCNYYSCALTYEGDDEAAEEITDDMNADGSLAVSSTRGQTEGEKMENTALQAQLEIAARNQAAEDALVEKREQERAVLDAAQAEETAKAQAAEAAKVEAAKAAETEDPEHEE